MDNAQRPKYKIGIPYNFLPEPFVDKLVKEGAAEVVDTIAKIKEILPPLLGKPYKWGASVTTDSPNTFDCSSLVAYLYKEGGYSLPRMALDQYEYCLKNNLRVDGVKDLQYGDLIFSKTDVNHVGIYVGEGKVVHASGTPDSKVIEENLETAPKFKNTIGFGRVCEQGQKRVILNIS